MTAHTRPEIERQLRLRLIPYTDNRDALVELGFTPAYPQLARDAYYGAVWTRAVDAHGGSTAELRSGAKMLVVERAFHVRERRRARRIGWRRTGVCAAVPVFGRAYSPLSASLCRCRRAKFIGNLHRTEPNEDIAVKRPSDFESLMVTTPPVWKEFV